MIICLFVYGVSRLSGSSFVDHTGVQIAGRPETLCYIWQVQALSDKVW
jgi:hypothetical protein